jgi:hypothetical protein
MKVVPYAAIGAAVLAGWVAPVAAQSSQADSAEAAGERARCAEHASHDELFKTRLTLADSTVAHVHGSSCPCSACRTAEPAR